MKTRIKKLLLLLLGLPCVVQAQDAYSTNADGGIYTYSTNADGSANIVHYIGPPWVVTIPTNINGLTVTSIGNGAFNTVPSLTSVTIPNSVTSIGQEAFFDCYNLTSVTIGTNVTSIGQETFNDCTRLFSVTIPNSVTNIGEVPFWDCTSLTAITVDAQNPVYSSVNGVLFDKSQATLLQFPGGLGGDYTIPSSVTNIGALAFDYCPSLFSVTIPGSVTSIGGGAFFQCISLTSVHFTGNAPSPTNDSTVFSGNPNGDPATVYYLPGTTGWGAMFDGRPTVPWFLPNPQILNNGPGFGVQPGGFGFTISWATNGSVVVEAATNLANPVWIPVSTDTLVNGTNYFSDPQWTNYPMRFYRAVGAYTVGGTLAGLPAGDTVTLQDNGSDNLTLSTNGTFTFPTALPNGHAYSVTISALNGATEITRTLMDSGGTISGANVTNVAVLCPPLYTGNLGVDMYNAAVADGTAHGGVPGVMYTENGGPFRVTAASPYSYDVALRYYPLCQLVVIEGTTSCSSTILPIGPAIQFGTALACGQVFQYGY
jgi:hypothetical protein